MIVKQAAKKARNVDKKGTSPSVSKNNEVVNMLTRSIYYARRWVILNIKRLGTQQNPIAIHTPINVVATIWVFYFIAIQKQPDGESY